MTPYRSPRSVLGNPPLNPIEKALFHLFAGLLDHLKPDFASARGARRELCAALAGPGGRTGPGEWERALPPSQAHTLASTPVARDPARWQAPEGSGAGGSGVSQRRFFGNDSSLLWRRATVGAGQGAPGAAGGGLAGGGHPHGSGGGSRRPGRGGWPRGGARHRRPRVGMCMLVPMHGPLHLIMIVSLCGVLVCILSFLWLFPSY